MPKKGESKYCGDCPLLCSGWSIKDGDYFCCSLYKKYDSTLDVPEKTNFASIGKFLLANEKMETKNGKPLKLKKCLKREKQMRERIGDDYMQESRYE